MLQYIEDCGKIILIGLGFLLGLLFVQPSVLAEEPEFDLTARSALLMEAETGRVIYAHNPHRRLPPASMTKIMTMLLVMEALEEGRVAFEDEVVTSEYAARMGGSQIWLEPGERLTLEEMMKGIAIVSANDCSVAVAEHISGSATGFINDMNQRARELGMENSFFYNTNGLPSGSSEVQGNYMSAYDLGLVSRELLKYPRVLEWTSTWIDYLRDGDSVLNNTNRLVRFFPGADGIKTGYTSEAGHGVTATAQRDNLRFIAVIMGAENSEKRFSEAAELLSYGFAAFEAKLIAEKEDTMAEIKVINARNPVVQIVVPGKVTVPLERGSEVAVKTRLLIEDNVEAPLNKGDQVGILEIYVEEELVEQVELITAREVEKLSFFGLLGRIFMQIVESLVTLF